MRSKLEQRLSSKRLRHDARVGGRMRVICSCFEIWSRETTYQSIWSHDIYTLMTSSADLSFNTTPRASSASNMKGTQAPTPRHFSYPHNILYNKWRTTSNIRQRRDGELVNISSYRLQHRPGNLSLVGVDWTTLGRILE